VEVDVRIEQFVPGDETAVLKLLADAELPVEDLTPDKLKHFWVARANNGSVIGVIGLEPFHEVGLLRSLAVHPSWRGRGLGLALTRHLEAYASEMGIKTLFLLTLTAAEFFPKLGYQVVQRAVVPEIIATTEEFRDACPASAVCLSKPLQAA
jgi:amino-acid N-acetyltransferase